MSERQPRFHFGRVARSSRTVTAGCFACNGSDPMWSGGNAVGVAARHHDATGHETWADQVISTRYGSTGLRVGCEAIAEKSA